MMQTFFPLMASGRHELLDISFRPRLIRGLGAWDWTWSGNQRYVEGCAKQRSISKQV